MRFPAFVRPLLITVSATLAFTLLPGCSQKSKLERHLANARKHEAAGNLGAAEIEYANVQRLDPQSPDAMAGLGSIFLDQGSLVAALPRLSAAKQMAPDNLENRNRLARALLTLGGASEARAEAIYVLDRRPDDGDAAQILAESSFTPEQIADAKLRLQADTAAARVGLAILALRERNLSEARSHTDRALELDATLPAAHSLAATIHLAERDLDAAGKSLEQAASLAPARSPYRIAYVRYLFSRQDSDGGRRALEEIQREAPDYIPAALMRAELSASSGSSDEALKILSDVIARDPDHPEALMMRASVHLSKGENQTAIEQGEALVAKYPNAAPMHYMLARAYAAAGDAKRALENLKKTLQLAPEHTEAAVLQAGLQIQTGDAAAAALGLRDLLKKQPANTRARILLADALRARGQPEEALRLYDDAISASPDDPMLRFFAGTLLALLGQTDKARDAFERALALRPEMTAAVERLVALDLAKDDTAAALVRATKHAEVHPDQPDAHVLVAKVAMARKDTVQAEAALRSAIKANPEHPVAYPLLSQIYLAEGRQDDALASLGTAVAKNPRDVASLMLMGILHQQKNESELAREAYEKLLQVNPGFVPALNNLAYLYSEHLGDLGKAYDLSNKARELRPADPIVLDTFGWILYQRREYTWAVSILADSASKLPDNPEVQYHLGMARYALGDEAGARTSLSAAVSAATDFPGKDKARASIEILDLDPERADDAMIAALRTRLAALPEDPVAQSRLAGALARRGEVAEALAAYEAAVKAHPGNAVALANLARFLVAQPDGRTRASELAKEAYKVAPENITVLHAVGKVALANGDHAWAASLLGSAARRASDSAAIQQDYAEAAFAVGQVDAAIAAARASLALDAASPRSVEIREFIELASASNTSAPSQEAVALATAQLARDPNGVPALLVTGRDKESRGDTEGALQAYEKALLLYPRFSPAIKARALLLARENPPTQRALEAALKAREALPGDSDVAAALGTIHFRRAEYPRATTLLMEAARAAGSSPEIHYMLGLAQKELGEKDRSQASLRRALELGLSGEAADVARAALENAD